MSLLTQASPFNVGEGKREKKKGNMTETFKRIETEYNNNNNNNSLSDGHSVQHIQSSKIEQQSKMENINMTQPSNDGDRLADFVVFPPPGFNESDPAAKGNHLVRPPPVSYSKNTGGSSMNGSSFSQSYSPTPYYKGISSKQQGPTDHSSKELMEKLNYMIHLLEEQQKEPTQNILEEFALYGLLGIFMIYMVDSFAKVGKYTR